jgi:prepilin-type N-terminal cleavage/methylation domain-containing protein
MFKSPTVASGSTASLTLPRRGFSLVEMMVAVIVLGILCSFGVPRFQQSLEQSRADVAGASLRAIWSAQRLYWLQNRTYATDLSELTNTSSSTNQSLLDPSITGGSNASYSYSITSASATAFVATATRSSGVSWSGTFTIDSNGNISGSVTQSGGSGVSITPKFQ